MYNILPYWKFKDCYRIWFAEHRTPTALSFRQGALVTEVMLPGYTKRWTRFCPFMSEWEPWFSSCWSYVQLCLSFCPDPESFDGGPWSHVRASRSHRCSREVWGKTRRSIESLHVLQTVWGTSTITKRTDISEKIQSWRPQLWTLNSADIFPLICPSDISHLFFWNDSPTYRTPN